ncbi:non-homologous end joining protein Ku [Kitasatospora sp. NPDC001175]|uniref:non-homologous end joining protein Ku n=1 Tax=Kitasatospora sp. NPDC001175 TaxID=3157103 RepID=UPI003D0462D1
MARPIWTGVLSFGLVTLPVALYSATESHTVSFHQIQRGTADRVRNRRVNERTGEEVPYSEIVKGYELVEGEYVIVEPEELEQLSPGRSKTIEIRGFVDLDQVDPIFFDTTYYLGPKGKEYAKIYALLVKALEASNKAGIALFSMRGKEYLTAVRAKNGMLVAHTMHFADEVRDPRQEVDGLPAATTAVGEKELAAARQLIDMLAVDWNPDEYHDTFAEQVRELIEAKAAGKEIAVSQGPQETPTNVVDLMDVLNRSVATAKDRATADREAGEAKPSRHRARKAAPRTSRTPKSAGGKKTITAKRAQPAADAKKRTGTSSKAEDLGALTKAELYKRASDLDIPQRSTMTRDQLQHALERAQRPRGRRLRAAS